jgi:hypothetical protein
MNKCSQDILGLLRGIQLVANASVKTQEAYLKHLWSHSSVREAVEKNLKETAECSKKVANNPSQGLENIGTSIKEAAERSSVVFQGLRQYMSSGRQSDPIGTVEISDDKKSKSYSSVKNIQNLDIASITLKELENLLAEHNKIRDVNLKLDEPKKIKKSKKEEKVKETKVNEIKVDKLVTPVLDNPKVYDDEKQVENMMKLITNYDQPTPHDNLNLNSNAALPEVRAL